MSGDASALLTQRALQAVARRRALGMHFIGHFLGLDGEPTGLDGVARLRLPAWPTAIAPESEPISDVEWGVLADLAMAQAIREQLTVGGRLATSTLVVHQIHHHVSRPVEAHGSVVWIDSDSGSAAVRVEMVDASGQTVAIGSSTFQVLPATAAGNVAPMDWSRFDSVPPVAPEDLTPGERQAIDTVLRNGMSQRVGGLVDALFAVDWEQIDAETVRGSIEIGPLHENRVGHLQGGVAYGLGAAAARVLIGGTHVVDGHAHYLRPGLPGQLTVTASVVRRGSRVSVVRVEFVSAGKVSAEMSFTLQG